MGNNTTTSSVLHEEEEPPLRIDNHTYNIRSIINENHNKDSLQGPQVVIFDRWKIAQDDLKDKQDKPSVVNDEIPALAADNAEDSNLQKQTAFLKTQAVDSDTSSSYEELSAIPINSSIQNSAIIKINSLPTSSQQQKIHNSCSGSIKSEHEKTQQMHSVNPTSTTKPSFVRKPRPNSLAIVSRSHDCLYTVGEFNSANTSSTVTTPNNAEVKNHLTLPSNSGDDVTSCLSNANRSVSADALRPNRPVTGLQQRRNCRPTSLHIPNPVQFQPQPSQTAAAHITSQQLPFNRYVYVLPL